MRRFAGMVLSLLIAGCASSSSAVSESVEIIGELESYLDGLADADRFSGAVLLAKDGEVLFERAYGLASRRFGVANDLDTRFNLGSMNKMFTSVVVAQLAQEGELGLGDTIDRYVSEEWLRAEDARRVQIQHLLTHTSGLGSYFNEAYMRASKTLFRELDDYQPLFENEKLAFEPGTRWQYSNSGMFLLGVIIESVTGKSYFDVVRERIYERAGMTRSDSYEMDRPVDNLAIGYSKDSDGWTNNYYKHVIKGGPAGGGFSTVRDLLAFDRALRSHQLLDVKHTELVWSPKPELSSPEYGFGFGVRGRPHDRIVGHSGGFSGISANLDMFLDSGYTAIVLSNVDRGAQPVAERLRGLVSGAP